MDMVGKYGRLLSSTGKMFGGETGGQGAAGLNALLSGMGSYQSFQRGQTFPGVMQAAGAAGSGARMLGAGGVAGSIGGLGSLAGLGYDLSQGRFGAQSVGQGLAGAGQLASGLGYGALGSALGGAAGGASALGTIATSIQGLTTGDDRRLGGSVGGLGGVAAGAAIGSVIPGIGTLVGAGLGGLLGSSLGGLFGQKVPHYFAVRKHAAGVGNTQLQGFASGIQEAAQKGDIAGIQKALGSGDKVRADFQPPDDWLEAMDMPKGSRVNLSTLKPEQFLQFLKLYKENPETVKITGSGDVPYLPQAQAEALASQAQAVGKTTLDGLVQSLGPALDSSVQHPRGKAKMALDDPRTRPTWKSTYAPGSQENVRETWDDMLQKAGQQAGFQIGPQDYQRLINPAYNYKGPDYYGFSGGATRTGATG